MNQSTARIKQDISTRTNTKIKLSRSDLIFMTIVYTILGIACALIVYPLYFIIIASFSDPTLVNAGEVLLVPKGIMWDAYERIFEYDQLWIGYRNTIIYTLIGTFLNVAMTMITAFPMSRPNFKGRKIFMVYMMFTMYFSGGLIPSFLINQSLGLYNNPLVMVVTGMVSITNVIVTITFMRSSIPAELFEAGYIDGISHFGAFMRIALPLSKAIIAVMALYYGVSHWNDYWTAMIYLNNQNYYPLQLILRGILTLNEIDPTMLVDIEDAVRLQNEKDLIKYASIIVSTIPLLVVYPFLQKYFVQGVMIGSLKG